jgi:hypothetical protein
MIIAQLIGGLGNQMFQYALGRHLAIKNDTVLKLDLQYYSTTTFRAYGLEPYPIKAKTATKREVRSLKGNRILKRLGIDTKHSYVLEDGAPFNPVVLESGDDTYLEGMWATEKYFKDIESTIRTELTPDKGPMLKQTVSVLNTIRRYNNPVSIHFRRGDYVTNPGIYKLPPEYYINAINIMREDLHNPHFFVFSDENIIIIDPSETITNLSGRSNAYEDLYLMSQCKHQIIANSSFSWWGAWLGKTEDQIVIAPKKYCYEGHEDTRDLYPEGWLKI